MGKQSDRLELLLKGYRPPSCVEWDGALDADGYGIMSRWEFGKKRMLRVHRYVVERKLGRRLNDGEDASHLCHNRRCFNPDHLIAESHAENMARIGTQPFDGLDVELVAGGLRDLDERSDLGVAAPLEGVHPHHDELA